MTTIGGFVDGILDGTIKKTKQNEYLILVSKEIKRLRILISSMLNMTRFESGTMSPNFVNTNITDLVIQTVFMFEKKIDDKHLEVEGLGSGRMNAVVDPDLMQQVIYNLVENAVKFVNEGGTLSFRFEQNDGLNIIGIKNTGEGLQNSEIQQVFDRFYKTDSSRGKDTTGLGLGLSISRKIVHLHDGHIVVKSVHGEYTEFLVEIPEKRNSIKKG
jgi:signal transduction histidine kinase